MAPLVTLHVLGNGGCSSFMLKIGWDCFAFDCSILLAHCLFAKIQVINF
jgi:hypothetical protein